MEFVETENGFVSPLDQKAFLLCPDCHKAPQRGRKCGGKVYQWGLVCKNVVFIQSRLNPESNSLGEKVGSYRSTVSSVRVHSRSKVSCSRWTWLEL